MKREAMISLSAAVLSLALLPAGSEAWALKSTNLTASSSSAAPSEVQNMVPAQAVLDRTLDARKMKSGQQFEATLDGKVKLKDGQELPRGTVLTGTIVTDNMQGSGNSKLTVRFTEARLKEGKSIPIDATIVGVAPAGTPNYQDAAAWTPQILRIDQVGAIKGVDLHSSLGAANSGVFVAAKKDDVRLSQGSELSLAITAKKNQSSGD